MNKVKTITPLSRGLPKTGQGGNHYDYADGHYQAGWWLGRTVAGNKVRFVEKELVSGEPVIIDRATRLIWPKNLTDRCNDLGAAKKVLDCIAWCEALDYGSFNDWRMPNVFEMISLFNGGDASPCAYSTVFINWVSAWEFWTSTMNPSDSDSFQQVLFNEYLRVVFASKVNTYHFLPVRSL